MLQIRSNLALGNSQHQRNSTICGQNNKEDFIMLLPAVPRK